MRETPSTSQGSPLIEGRLDAGILRLPVSTPKLISVPLSFCGGAYMAVSALQVPSEIVEPDLPVDRCLCFAASHKQIGAVSGGQAPSGVPSSLTTLFRQVANWTCSLKNCRHRRIGSHTAPRGSFTVWMALNLLNAKELAERSGFSNCHFLHFRDHALYL